MTSGRGCCCRPFRVGWGVWLGSRRLGGCGFLWPYRPPHSVLERNEPRHQAAVLAGMSGLVQARLGSPTPFHPMEESGLLGSSWFFLGGLGWSGVLVDSDTFLVEVSSGWGGVCLVGLPWTSSNVKAVPLGTCTCCTYGVLPEEATPAPDWRSGKGSGSGVLAWGGPAI